MQELPVRSPYWDWAFLAMALLYTAVPVLASRRIGWRKGLFHAALSGVILCFVWGLGFSVELVGKAVVFGGFPVRPGFPLLVRIACRPAALVAFFVPMCLFLPFSLYGLRMWARTRGCRGLWVFRIWVGATVVFWVACAGAYLYVWRHLVTKVGVM